VKPSKVPFSLSDRFQPENVNLIGRFDKDGRLVLLSTNYVAFEALKHGPLADLLKLPEFVEGAKKRYGVTLIGVKASVNPAMQAIARMGSEAVKVGRNDFYPMTLFPDQLYYVRALPQG
jgi:hypothetical protein